MAQRPVVYYLSCDACGDSSVAVGPKIAPAWQAANRLQLSRCVACGVKGRHMRTERTRPDAQMWPEAARAYDYIDAHPDEFASPNVLAA